MDDADCSATRRPPEPDTPHINGVVLQNQNAAAAWFLASQSEDLLKNLLAAIISRMCLARKNELQRSIRIRDQSSQKIEVLQDQLGSLVRRKSSSLIIPILLASGLFAQITIVASVDKNPVSIGENFQLKYTVINYSPNKLNTPLFIGFEIVIGPSKTESMVLRNNEETISGTVTYTLKALQSGTFKIGKATLTDSSKTFASEEISLVVTDTKIVDIVDEPRSTTITPVLSSNDSLYFKDGTVISGKGALVQECVSGMGKKKKKRDELNVDADAACTCMMEKIAKHYTYAEFLGDGTKNGGNLFTRSQTENPEAYKDMLSCVFENMGEKANNDGEKNAKSPSTSNASSQQPTGDFMEKFFVDACVQEHLPGSPGPGRH